MSLNPKLSIIIANLDRADLTRSCMKAVMESTEHGSYEIIVVDNGSSIEQVEQLQTMLSSHFTLVRLNRNAGFGEANNIGVERADGEYIVFLNNDVKVTSGWASSMLEVFSRSPRVGAVGPKLLFPDGSLQEAGAYILPDGATVQLGKNGQEPPAPYVGGIHVTDYCSAACLLMKKTDFLNVGGFDPIFDPAYFEDADLAIRLRSVGLFSYYCGQAVAFHEENSTSRRIWSDEVRSTFVTANQRKLTARWGSYLKRRIEQPCEPDPLPPVKWEAEANPSRNRRIILYSSNPIQASDASQRLLLVASAFQDTHDVILASDEVVSRCRVYSLCREFRIQLNSFRTRRISDVTASDDDLMVSFDTEGQTNGRFKNRIEFERNGEKLIDLLD
jgi:GT2 family glycosyltransferase